MPASLDTFYRRYYTQLLRRAAAALRNDPQATLTPASLVHEAWLRLHKASDMQKEPDHFRAIAARLMRRILVDAARRRKAQRRGGKERFRVTLSNLQTPVPCSLDRLIDFHTALDELGRRKARLEVVAELYFFAGATAAEVAQEVGLSRASVERDVAYIRGFLERRNRL